VAKRIGCAFRVNATNNLGNPPEAIRWTLDFIKQRIIRSATGRSCA